MCAVRHLLVDLTRGRVCVCTTQEILVDTKHQAGIVVGKGGMGITGITQNATTTLEKTLGVYIKLRLVVRSRKR